MIKVNRRIESVEWISDRPNGYYEASCPSFLKALSSNTRFITAVADAESPKILEIYEDISIVLCGHDSEDEDITFNTGDLVTRVANRFKWEYEDVKLCINRLKRCGAIKEVLKL